MQPPFPFAFSLSQQENLFPMSWLFTSGGQSIGASTSASVLPMNIQDWFPSGLTAWSCCPKDSQESSPTPQFKSVNSSVLSFLYSPTLTSIHYHWKTIVLTRQIFADKVMSLLFFVLFCFVFYYYYFFLLYNIVLVLPYINIHLPWVYTCSPSWTPLPPPSPYHPSGSSQCTSPKLPVSCMEPGLTICILYYIMHVLMPFSQIIPLHPHRVQNTVLYICVSLAILHTGLSLPSF